MTIALLYLGTVLIWGSTWLAIKFQLGVVAPEVSLAYRLLLAAVVLLVYCVANRRRMRFSVRDHIGMAGLGLLLFSANYFFFYLATGYMTTGLVAVVFSGIVVTNIIFGAVLLGNPVQPRVAIGAAIGISGLIIIFWPEVTAFDLQSDGTLGLLLCIAGTVIASLGNMMSVNNQRRGLPVLQANAYGMSYGAALMVLFTLFSGQTFNFDATPTYVGSLVYLSIFGSVFAFGFYLTLLGRIGADRAAYATVLFPVIALGLSTVFENFQWSTGAFAGMLLVVGGNVLVLGRSTRAKIKQVAA